MKKIALLLLAAIPVMGGEPLPKFGFADQLIAPVRIHLLQTPGELNLTTTLEPKDITRTSQSMYLVGFFGLIIAFAVIYVRGSLI